MFLSSVSVLPAKHLWFFCVTLQQPLFDVVLLWQVTGLFGLFFQASFDFTVTEGMSKEKMLPVKV